MNVTRPRRLLALSVYPERVAATRFRLMQLLPYLRARGWEVRFEPFLNDEFLTGFYSSGRSLRKAAYLASRSLFRAVSAATVTGFDAVFIQREAALIGPAYVESILHSLKRLPIIFDFDDAIWQHDLPRSTHPMAAKLLKSPDKCWQTMSRASRVIAGSSYLASRASEVSASVHVVPTVVSAASWTPLACRDAGDFFRYPPRIGWIGTHSTAHQLQLVEPALQQLRAEGHEFEVHLVGAGDDSALQSLEVHSRPWRLDQEIREFQEIDIGLAPMCDGVVYEGKCGFKQLQYMAVGVPFVSSWVGGAKDFVVDGENALVARCTKDWYHHLRALLNSRDLRAKLASTSRQQVEARYCIEHQAPRVVDLIEEGSETAR